MKWSPLKTSSSYFSLYLLMYQLIIFFFLHQNVFRKHSETCLKLKRLIFCFVISRFWVENKSFQLNHLDYASISMNSWDQEKISTAIRRNRNIYNEMYILKRCSWDVWFFRESRLKVHEKKKNEINAKKTEDINAQPSFYWLTDNEKWTVNCISFIWIGVIHANCSSNN